jgi:hypothetical protein
MTVVKSAVKFKISSLLFFSFSGGLWLVFEVLLISTVENTIIVKLLSLVLFILFVIVAIRYVLKTNKEFCCPDCGGEVDAPYETQDFELKAQPILRHCRNCDVLWHVGNTPSAG